MEPGGVPVFSLAVSIEVAGPEPDWLCDRDEQAARGTGR